MHTRLDVSHHPFQWRGLVVAGLFHLGLIYALLVGLGTKTVPVHFAPVPADLLLAPHLTKQEDLPLLRKPVLPTHIPSTSLNLIKFPIIDSDATISPSSVSKSETATSGDLKSTGPQIGNAIGSATDARIQAGNCTNAQQVGADTAFPEKARRLGLTSGSVQVRFSVSAAGEVTIDDVDASNRAFEPTAIDVARHLKCAAGRYVFPMGFKLTD